ncbi:MAG: DUF2807 domain-containing protein [Bacteroidota bacterium]
MKKNISINIGGIIFHIEEDGYEKLKNYLDSVNNYFSSFEDSKEIIDDIEGRIAEIFLARLEDGKQVISQEDVDDLIAIMGTTKDFDATIESEEQEGKQAQDSENKEEPIPPKPETKRLFRDLKRRVVGGVAAGIAHYFKIDPIWVRLIILAFFFTIVLTPASGFVAITYIIFWIAIPGSDKLEEDKAIKKLFRDPEDRVLGGVCGGLARYFGVDKGVIRIIFVVAIFFGAGILAYIILWIIVPEAKTITEKMQMQGEPVTISNIEETIKKNLNVKEGEESGLVKILLFPFRLIALVFKALGELLGPFLKFAVEALRIVLGVFLLLLGFALFMGFTVAFLVLLGVGGTLAEWAQFGPFPAEYLISILSTITIISAYLVTTVPVVGLSILGISIIVKKPVAKAVVGWSMLGLWLFGLLGLAFTVPSVVHKLRVENSYKERRTFDWSQERIPLLTLNEDEYTERFFSNEDVKLRLRGHEDSVYLLVLDFESRGSSRADAKRNARSVSYSVVKTENGFEFDSHLDYENEVPFRFQNVRATFYIPYGQVFEMEENLAEILINTLHLNGYRAYQMDGNSWVFDNDGIRCLSCKNRRGNTSSRRSLSGKTQYYDFEEFDEVKLNSLFDFEIEKGAEYSVEVEGNKEHIEALSLVQSGDELEVKYDKNWKWWKQKRWKRKLKLYITMPELDQLTVAGACEGEVRGFNQEEMSFELEGASEVDVNIRVETVYVDMAGASEFRISGAATDFEADVVGASKLRAFDFRAEEVDVTVLGASSARVYAGKELQATASGASTIRYRGNPLVTSKSNGLSTIKRD